MPRTDEQRVKVGGWPARIDFGPTFTDVHARVVHDAGGRSAVAGMDVPGASGLSPILFLMEREDRDPSGEPTGERSFNVGFVQRGDVKACLAVTPDGGACLQMTVDGEPRQITLGELEVLIRSLVQLERDDADLSAVEVGAVVEAMRGLSVPTLVSENSQNPSEA